MTEMTLYMNVKEIMLISNNLISRRSTIYMIIIIPQFTTHVKFAFAFTSAYRIGEFI
jgi:hypothetical protein